MSQQMPAISTQQQMYAGLAEALPLVQQLLPALLFGELDHQRQNKNRNKSAKKNKQTQNKIKHHQLKLQMQQRRLLEPPHMMEPTRCHNLVNRVNHPKTPVQPAQVTLESVVGGWILWAWCMTARSVDVVIGRRRVVIGRRLRADNTAATFKIQSKNTQLLPPPD